MPKLAKPAIVKTSVTKRAAAVAKPSAPGGKYDNFAQSTFDEPIEQSLILVVHGQIGVGKTLFAATASKHFPEKLPTERFSGKKPKYFLSDMFWLSIDKKACAGFRERGIGVNQFDLTKFMMTETGPSGWRAAGFTSPPNVFKAAEFGLRVAKDSGATFLVVDTVSMLDRMFNSYWMKHCPVSKRTGGKDTQGMYGEILGWHLAFSEAAMLAAPAVIFNCHSKLAGTEETAEEKARNNTLQTAAGGILIPDITGKGQLPYKGHCSAQLAVVAIPKPGGGLTRFITTVKTAEHETKNRWELSLKPKEEPHCGRLLAKVAV